jgi:N utilization substance protein A
MNQEMLRIIDAIARDRHVEKESLFNDIEQAMVSAARKHFAAPDTEDFTCTVDRLTGEITLFRDGQKISLEALGRIPAQTAKQVMIQKFREDERASIYDEYSQRIGEIITGTAQRYEGGAMVISLGRAEGFMPRSEQIPGETHQPGERVRCMILDVRESGSQVKIVLSRSHPDFIRRLFEVEVPEVSERIIEIRALSREPGHRTKVAVSSIDSKVDAVGACVGVRGSRIKNIVDELGGEKIDIVRWNESSQVLIANALRPAEVVEISLCFELGRATVVVNEDQLSLAIGKRGQNVRLAARLTGWDVDILTPAEFAKGLDILEETLRQIDGVTDEMLDRMAVLGLISVFDIEEVGLDVLVEQFGELGMTPELAQEALTRCTERGKIVAEEQQREREEAERRKREALEAPPADDADAQAVAVLGLGGEEGPARASAEPPAPAEGETSDEGGDIVDMLLGSRSETPAESSEEEEPPPVAGEEPVDVAIARERSDEEDAPSSPAGEEIVRGQEESDIARLAEGESQSPEQENDESERQQL